eukprot:UN01219
MCASFQRDLISFEHFYIHMIQTKENNLRKSQVLVVIHVFLLYNMINKIINTNKQDIFNMMLVFQFGLLIKMSTSSFVNVIKFHMKLSFIIAEKRSNEWFAFVMFMNRIYTTGFIRYFLTLYSFVCIGKCYNMCHLTNVINKDNMCGQNVHLHWI